MPGPVPKRSSERRRENKPEIEIVSAPGSEPVDWPDADPDWHEIARDWFLSLKLSGQAAFYEPSDVARARYVANAMSKNLHQGQFSSMLFAAVNTAAGELLDTEGSRRRLRVELAKAVAEDPEQSAAVASLDEARSRLGGRKATS